VNGFEVDTKYNNYKQFAMPSSVSSSATPPPDRIGRHKAGLLQALIAVCESLRRIHSEPAARQACAEISALLRAKLRGLRRERRG